MLSLTDPNTRSSAPTAERKPYARIPEVLPIPDLIDLQLQSFRWFIDNGLRELLYEISPIQDFTGKAMELRFKQYEFGEPKYSSWSAAPWPGRNPCPSTTAPRARVEVLG